MSVGCSFFPSDSNNAIKQKQFNFCLWFLRCLNECDLLATFVAVLLCFFVCFEWKGDTGVTMRNRGSTRSMVDFTAFIAFNANQMIFTCCAKSQDFVQSLVFH